MKRFTKIMIMWLGAVVSVMAQPTNNPYISFYPGTPSSHWTQVLRWSNIFNVTTYGAVANDNQDDLQAIKQAIDAASQSGGGIVYFPTGVYNVSDSLILKPGVVLRGDDPTGITSAKVAGYQPPSRLEFPQYIFDTTAFGGAGYPVTSAFKTITNTPDARNIGVVNLDINRAGIEFHPLFDSVGMATHPGGTTPNYQPVGNLRNVIVFGTRTNNVAYPDPRIPALYSGPNQMRPWQRFFYNFVSNIDVYAKENAIISNNRINDHVTDSYDQPGYKVRNRCTSCLNYRNVGQPGNATVNAANYVEVLSGEHAKFDYSAHYGISLNRNKKVIQNGSRTIKPMIWYPDPYQEPSLYAKGFEIDDNWLYKTDRVGIWCAGYGMKIRRNIIRDTAINESRTWATPKKRFLNTNGTEVQRNYSATYENRGIDYGGGDILIEDNEVLVSAADFPESGQYGSIDGEGIMDQGNGGGTNPNGIIIRRNKVASNRDDCTNPTIGIYRTESAHNVLYQDNEFTGNSRCLQIDANRTNTPYPMTNILMTGNKNVKNLQLRALGGGRNAVAHSNEGTAGGGTMFISCFVREFNNVALTLATAGCAPVQAGSPDTTDFPTLSMADPADVVTLAASRPVYTLKANITNGQPDSVVFYLDAVTRLGLGTININGDTATFDWTMPTTDGQYKITANAYKTINGILAEGKSNIGTIVVDDGDAFTNNPQDVIVSISNSVSKATPIRLYPNPAKAELWISGHDEGSKLMILDNLGRQLTVAYGNRIDVRELPQGTYSLRIESRSGVAYKRFIKE